MKKNLTLFDCKLIKPVGSTKFGQVFLMQEKESGEYFGMNVIFKETINNNDGNALMMR